MDQKQSNFSAFSRGFSPSKTRSRSASPVRSQTSNNELVDPINARSGCSAPLIERPVMDSGEVGECADPRRERNSFLIARGPSASESTSGSQSSDLRMLLSVMGAPLAPARVSYGEPLHHISIKDASIIQGKRNNIQGKRNNPAQEILKKYIVHSGGTKLKRTIKNSYARGKLEMVMVSENETGKTTLENRNGSKSKESGEFELWQMPPEMWYFKLAAGGSKVHAGCNGKLVWRHIPWLGAHAIKGPVRPLRRALQGLDPLTTWTMFADSECIGEKEINGEPCFVLKLKVDDLSLKLTSKGPAEETSHLLSGYFSQRSGLLVHVVDSHTTKVQSSSGDGFYLETSIESFLNDYRSVEGVMIAHSGRSSVILCGFGGRSMSHTTTIMEETWTIEEFRFDLTDLYADHFKLTSDIESGSDLSETHPLVSSYGSKVADGSVDDNVLGREEV